MNISITTAQNVAIDYTPAGVLERALAYLIDFLIVTAVVVGLLYLSYLISPTFDYFKYFFYFLIPYTFYHLVCEAAFHGRSVGKLLLGLRVVRLDGRRLTFWDCLLRWIFRLIDITLCSGAIALLVIGFSRRSQRLGDMAAGTTVIRQSRPSTLTLPDAPDLPDDYRVVFPSVTLLTDADIRTIRTVYADCRRRNDYSLLPTLVTRVKAITGIQSDLLNTTFIETILRDYTASTRS